MTRLLRKSFVLFATCLSLPTEALAQGGNPTARIEIKQVNPADTLSGKLMVTLTLINTSGRDISVRESRSYKDYAVSVYNDRRAKDVPLSQHGVEVSSEQSEVNRNFVRVLKPNETSTATLDLHDLFNFADPGSYYILAKTRVFTGAENKVVSITSARIRILAIKENKCCGIF